MGVMPYQNFIFGKKETKIPTNEKKSIIRIYTILNISKSQSDGGNAYIQSCRLPIHLE